MLDGSNQNPEQEKAALEQYLQSKITIPGCSIEITDTDIIIRTPEITKDTNIIQLENNAEVAEYNAKIAGRKLTVNIPHNKLGYRIAAIGIKNFVAGS